MARPVLLTDTVIKAITGNISRGMYPEQSAIASGLSRSTYYRYMDMAEKAVESYNGDDLSDLIEADVHVKLWDAIKKADANLEARVVSDTLTKVEASNNAIMGITFLSRRYRDRWSERVETEDKSESLRIFKSIIEEFKRPDPILTEIKPDQLCSPK
jgi:hypothetical protein